MDYSSVLRPLSAANKDANKEPEKNVVSMDSLDTLQLAGKIEKEIQFPVTCAIKNGVPIFFAQLKGGKRFSCTPVMPKAEMGGILAPPNGEEGHLIVELSENAQLTLSSDGKYEFSVRPTFIAWESVKDREARLKAEAAKKVAK